MTSKTKPEGPIFMDFTAALYDLPIAKVVAVANLALNKLNLREIGETAYHAGVEFGFGTTDEREKASGLEDV